MVRLLPKKRTAWLLLAGLLACVPAPAAGQAAFPGTAAPGHRLAVVSDGFSSFLALRDRSTGRWQAWSFAQKEWYLDLRQGVRGALSTVLPTEGVILRGRLARLPANQYGREVRAWDLELGRQAADTLLSWLRAHVDTTRRYRRGEGGEYRPEPIPPGEGFGPGWSYHPTDLDYTVWWNCHDYLLRALEIAGLLERPFLPLVITADELEQVLAEHFGEPRRPPLAP
jgi:hypothetical protein